MIRVVHMHKKKYGKYRRLENRYIVLISILVVALLIGSLTFFVRDNRRLNPVEKVVKDSISFVSNVITTPVRFFSSKGHKNTCEITDEVNHLKAREAELEKELEHMKKTLELNRTLSETSYLNATITARDVGYWYDTITIDKGSMNGVKEDMAVINKDGLIGKVEKTSYYHSTVKLLTSNSNVQKISVKIQVGDKFVNGLLSGYDAKKKVFHVEGISENTEILEGSMVTTTGLGNLFPSGIYIGKVKAMKKDNFDLAQLIEVTSDVHFDDLDFVTVLKREDNAS